MPVGCEGSPACLVPPTPLSDMQTQEEKTSPTVDTPAEPDIDVTEVDDSVREALLKSSEPLPLTLETAQPPIKTASTPTDNTPVIQVEATETSHANAAPDDSTSNSLLSFFSNLSAPIDTFLLTHAQNLRSEVDVIKLNICSYMKIDLDKFATISPTMIKNCSSLNKVTLAAALLSMLSHAESVCAVVSGTKCDHESRSPAFLSAPPLSVPSTVHDSYPLHKSLGAIQTSIDNLRDNADQLKTLDSINTRLSELKIAIDSFSNSKASHASTPDIYPPVFNINAPAPYEANIDNLLNDAQNHVSVDNTEHILSYTPDFVGPDLNSRLISFLDQQSEAFEGNTESGHSVLSFGEPYKYHGAKAATPKSNELPEVISELVSKIKHQCPDAIINQCLINKYTDKNSFLPKHSDNESSIVHGSSIFTVSLGGECLVKFTKKGSSEGEVVETIHGQSLYAMSKNSQLVWEHRIDPCDAHRDLRYSITFRYVSSNSKGATLIIGDSNTRFLRFGSGKGTFGHRLPGKRVECFTIGDIDPSLCIGYQNIVVHCGVNNIKREGANVKQCVDNLIRKLTKIREICPYAKISVSPILPTRCSWLNERAIEFNRFLFSFCETNGRIGTLNFNSFLDENGFLDRKYCRYMKQDDPIHLGSNGIFKLSRVIADKVLGSPVDGRTYSTVVKSTNDRFAPRPRRSIVQ